MTCLFELGLASLPLLILDNIWVDPHDLSRFCHDQNEALSFLLFSHRVDDIQSCLWDWDQVVLDSHLQESLENKSHHVGGDFFCSDLRVKTLASTNA